MLRSVPAMHLRVSYFVVDCVKIPQYALKGQASPVLVTCFETYVVLSAHEQVYFQHNDGALQKVSQLPMPMQPSAF